MDQGNLQKFRESKNIPLSSVFLHSAKIAGSKNRQMTF